MAKSYDLVIRGARVVDGTGAPARAADVGVKGDTIADVGTLEPAADTPTLEASGLVLAPGFIDAWAEADLLSPLFPDAESKLLQGVTAEVQGAGSQFPFPLAEGALVAMGRPEDTALLTDWTDARGFLLRVAKTGSGVHRSFFAGYGAIRSLVVGPSAGAPTRDEARKISKELELALEAGCLGLAVDLTEPPAAFASLEELVELARQLADAKAVLALVLRDSGPGLERAVEEALEVSARTGVELLLPSIRITGSPNWTKIEWVEARLARAIEDGTTLTATVEPYTAWAGPLGSILPPAARGGGERALAERLKAQSFREEMLRAIAERAAGDDEYWSRITLARSALSPGEGASGATAEGQPSPGRSGPAEQAAQRISLAELASARKRPPPEVVLELLAGGLASRAHFHELSEANVERMLGWPFVAIGSAEPARPVSGARVSAPDHPRARGTFPRVLRRFVSEKKLLGLEEAVRRMTSLPAERLALGKRGRIEPGCAADIVLFRPETVSDGSTFGDPSARPSGIDHVLVAGRFAVRDGLLTGGRHGRILRRPQT